MKRKIKKYKNSDWLFITPKNKIRIMKLTTSYFYHPKRKMVVTLPMERHFYILIGRKGKDSSDKIYRNKSGFVTPFTYVRRNHFSKNNISIPPKNSTQLTFF